MSGKTRRSERRARELEGLSKSKDAIDGLYLWRYQGAYRDAWWWWYIGRLQRSSDDPTKSWRWSHCPACCSNSWWWSCHSTAWAAARRRTNPRPF